MSGVVLDCHDVYKSYGGIAALDGVSARFDSGKITAVIGPNGAGKTTLLNVISGFRHCERGQVVYGGRNIAGLPPERISRLGIARTFQRPRVITELTVIENVLLATSRCDDENLVAAVIGRPSRARREQLRERAESALHQVNLTGHDDRLGGELSYGQQKLLSLATCIATGARVLLLDEPLTGVAPSVTEQILCVLHDLVVNDRTIVFIEHDLLSVRVAADLVIAMHHGKIIITGAPGDVLSSSMLVEAFLE